MIFLFSSSDFFFIISIFVVSLFFLFLHRMCGVVCASVFMYMMDSMTDGELDGKVDIEKCPSRIARIARGSGTHPEQVLVLLKCHKQFEGVVKKMGKSGLMKGGESQIQKNMSRNPAGVMQQLSKAMDPRMLAQMGGAGNVMNMMKEMSNMDMGDMQKMMGKMGGMGGM